MPHDIFISYSAGDKTCADAACATLESHGVRCWIAPRDILAGAEYAAAIVTALHESRALVLIFSSGANQSPQVLRELERAVSRGLPIVPLRVENVMPSAAMEYYISSCQWLEAHGAPLDQQMLRLADTVKLLLSRMPGPYSPALPLHVAEAASQPATCSTTPKFSKRIQGNRRIILAGCAVLLAGALAYRFWPRSNPTLAAPKITQISQWNRPIDFARLAPDGHAIAFSSTVNGIQQVFVMLTSGGSPLQLTRDKGDKNVENFSPDGKEIYYVRFLGRNEVWAVPSLGGSPRYIAPVTNLVPSYDGATIYYQKSYGPGIFRASISGAGEELVYRSEGTGRSVTPLLPFPGGNELLAAGFREDPNNFSFLKINLTSHEAFDLGEVSGNKDDVVWTERGKTVVFSRTVNALTNIWSYSLQDRSLKQITFGAGRDTYPMPAPEGKGIYYVNAKSSGLLAAYNVHTKQSTDILLETATQPEISPDGKHVAYVTTPQFRWNVLWVSDVDGRNRVQVAAGEQIAVGGWAPDNFHLAFIEVAAHTGSKGYIVGADGSGLHLLRQTKDIVCCAVWSPNQKSVYVTASEPGKATPTVKEWSLDGSSPERFVDNCGAVSDVDPGGKYVLGVIQGGEKTGIYEVALSDWRCIPLLPGAETFAATFARDGKSFLYAVSSRDTVTIYRQLWKDGKVNMAPKAALTVPFAFPLMYGFDNAYDFSKDLSIIVYLHPDSYADLYVLTLPTRSGG